MLAVGLNSLQRHLFFAIISCFFRINVCLKFKVYFSLKKGILFYPRKVYLSCRAHSTHSVGASISVMLLMRRRLPVGTMVTGAPSVMGVVTPSVMVTGSPSTSTCQPSGTPAMV